MNEEHNQLHHEIENDVAKKERNNALALPIKGLYEIGGAILVAFAFLIPIFFIPSPFFNFTAGKILLLISFVSVVALLLVMFMLRSGRAEIPKNPIFLAALSIPIVYLLSSIFSVSGFSLSIAGYGSEAYTFSAITFFFLLFFLTWFFFQKNAHVFYFYLAVLGSGLVLALFFLLRFIIGSDFLSLGFFDSLNASPLESWSAVGVLFGIILVLSIFTFEMFRMRSIFRWILGLVMLISLFFLVLTGITWYWVAIAIVLLLSIFYQVTEEDREDASGIPFLSVVVLFISIAFVFFGSPLSNALSGVMEVSSDDLRPSAAATVHVAKSTILEDPLKTALGAGPMDFSYQWMQHKPEGIMGTRFWNAEFGQGFSFLSSVPVTTGVVGVLAWVSFIVLYLLAILKGFFQPFRDIFTRYVFITSASASILLLIALFMTLLPSALLALFFMFAAIPLAVMAREKRLATVPLEFNRKNRKGSVNMIVAIVMAGLLLLFGAFLVKNTISGVFFERSAFSFYGEGDVESAESNFTWAVSLSEQDRYYRTAAEYPLERIREAVARVQAGDMSEEDYAGVIRSSFNLARGRASEATEIREVGYRNWLTLGNIYQEMLPFNFSDIDPYQEASQAYEKAREHNPNNPGLVLQLARLEFTNGNLEGAKKYNDEALEMKPNYANAIFFNSRIAIEEGNLDEAKESVQQAISLEPYDPGLYFQLGVLHYEEGEMSDAVKVFNQAVNLSPRFDNARYFLSLSLYQTGQEDEAITVLEELVERNRETPPQLTAILDNMREGEDDPLEGVADFGEPTPEMPMEEEVPGPEDLEEGELEDLEDEETELEEEEVEEELTGEGSEEEEEEEE
ncbi:MAG: tetratricopeptide repeat protein [Candidatus Paceibacterota bacterium]